MRRAKISTKMILWSTVSSLFVVLICFLVLYGSTSALLNQMLRDDLKLAVQQISAQIEKKQGILIYEEETPIAPEISYYVVEESGSELISVGEDITLFDDEPFHENDYTCLIRENSEWLILDSAPLPVEGDAVRIRAAIRCTLN